MSGLFLGHELVHNFAGRSQRGERVELPIAALPTHTFVCGATGAGKTVFAKAIVEEAALSGVPVIAIDLKGDLASLALTGDLLRHPDIGHVLGPSSAEIITEYLEGVEGMPAIQDRQREFASRVDVRLFTPRSAHARRLALTGLPTFSGPSSALDHDDRRTLIEALARSLVARSSNLNAKQEIQAKVVEEVMWSLVERGIPLEGKRGVERLARELEVPPFEELGGVLLDEFIAPRSRAELRASIASRIVGASASMYEGEALNVDTLIGGGDGRTPIAVIYLGHLSGFPEQAGVIAQVCSEVYRWMRRSGGSDKPRALVYIDEVGGGNASTAFYPSFPFNPPSKAPLALLVKQGRSAGVGVLLATQNPVSVDVQGLGNVGTWAVGALRQRNDQDRVAHLFEGSSQHRARLRGQLASAQRGEFLVKHPGATEPLWVRERWLCTVHRQLSPEQLQALYQIRSGVPVTVLPPEPPRPPPPPRPRATGQAPLGSAGGETRVLPQTATVEVKSGRAPEVPAWRLTWEGGSCDVRPGTRTVLGRSPTAGVVLSGDTVSREHAELIVGVAGEIEIEHRSAKNATKVDGVTVHGRLAVAADRTRATLLLGEVAVLLERVG